MTVKDHLGNEYTSISKMAKAYGLHANKVYNRINQHGWSIEKALTHDSNVYDHKNIPYRTYPDMCDAYNIDYNTFRARRNYGWSLQAALETPRHGSKNGAFDHLGNKYPNKEEMCKHYNINTKTFDSRKRSGLSLEECLLGKYKIVDENGKKFHTIKDFLNEYNISYSKYKKYENQLDKLTESKPYWLDHLGNKFSTQKEMCNHYNLSSCTFRKRIASGKTIEEALMLPVRKVRKKHSK